MAWGGGAGGELQYEMDMVGVGLRLRLPNPGHSVRAKRKKEKSSGESRTGQNEPKLFKKCLNFATRFGENSSRLEGEKKAFRYEKFQKLGVIWSQNFISQFF